MNFDYESRKLGIALNNVLNEFNLPLSLKVFILDEIATSYRQQMETNIQSAFAEEAAKQQAEQEKPKTKNVKNAKSE